MPGFAVVVATEWLGLGVEMSTQVIDAVIVIVPSYLAGQGIVDAIAAYDPNGKKS